MGAATRNSASATGLINCPKCGFEQEKRLDCKKCGVIFSKYYSLYASNSPNDSVPAADPNALSLVEQDLRATFSDLQEQVKALTARFADAEFGKAERNQLRMDLKALEQQLNENLAQFENRLDQIEKRLENPPVCQSQQDDIDSHIHLLYERLEQMQDKLGRYDFGGQCIADLTEKSDANSRQATDLENQFAALRKDVQEIREALDAVCRAKEAEEPRTPLEDDVHVIRRNLDEMRQFLSKHIMS